MDDERTGKEWIAAFAEALGTEAPSDEEIEALLDLAGVAARGSERIAAPIACYLVGRTGIAIDAAKGVAAET